MRTRHYCIFLQKNGLSILGCAAILHVFAIKTINGKRRQNPQKKGPVGPVGIKNSWKYEKDLIIFNEIIIVFTINHLCNI